MTARVADLIAREQEARDHMALVSYWAETRRFALLDLHQELGTWQKVADATGQKLAAVHKAANQPRKKKP